MSSTLTANMSLIASAHILPKNQMATIFEDCLKELGGEIRLGSLVVKGVKLGAINIGERIVLRYPVEFNDSNRSKLRELVRDTFTRRVDIAQKNYLAELERQKKEIEASNQALEEIKKNLEAIQKVEKKSKEAMERQRMSQCEAIKGELIDAAMAQGYEIAEEKTKEGVQLQFIRRSY